MSPKYPHLFAPLKIRNTVLKNRLTASNSLPHFLQGPETYPADPVIAHYEGKARSASMVSCMEAAAKTTNSVSLLPEPQAVRPNTIARASIRAILFFFISLFSFQNNASYG